jgi:AAA+ superfamily predicted ATPase
MKNNLLTKPRHLPKIQFNILNDSFEISIIENTQEQTQPAFRTISPDDYIELGKHFQVRKNEFEEIQKEIDNIRSIIALKKQELQNLENGLLGSFFNKTEINSTSSVITETTSRLNSLIEVQQTIRVEIDFNLGLEQAELFNQAIASFQKLIQSNKIWSIADTIENETGAIKKSVDRRIVDFTYNPINFINSSYQPIIFRTFSDTFICIYPAFALVINNYKTPFLIPIAQLDILFASQRFMENDADIPKDTKIIDQTWSELNNDGSKNLLAQNNKSIPIVEYGNIELIGRGYKLKEEFHISNFSAAEASAHAVQSYLKSLEKSTEPASALSEDEFNQIKTFADKHLAVYANIEKQQDALFELYKKSNIKEFPFTIPMEMLEYFFLLDLMICFKISSNIKKTRSKESFVLHYIIAKKKGFVVDDFAKHSVFYSQKLIDQYEKIIVQLGPEADEAIKAETTLYLSTLLNMFDKDLDIEYRSSLYRFASIVVKIDGKVSKKEEAALKRIMVCPQENIEISPVEHSPTIDQSNDTSVETALKALNELTGLTAVKAEINTLINFIKVQKAREESGLKTTSLSLHIVFTGNPGTGKTTVARIVAQIYKALGVLTQGQLIETDRSGLIAEYVGQTAVKVNTTVDSALNGVLFIDEAYSIVGDKDDSFGKEAVSTLIKRMEDDRKNLIVILAGYTDQMNTFIETNPGFKSRFNRYIDFSDYTPEELLAIYESMSLKLDFVLTDKAKLKLVQVLSNAYSNRDETFGNGRYVRNLFEKSMELQANRIAVIGKLTIDLLRTIEEIDIPD